MDARLRQALVKVPEATAVFWIVKILATTLGETAGDAVSMSLGLGYLAGTAIFLGLFVAIGSAQVRAKAFHPPLYWATIIASTTVGTTLADFADRSLGVGYAGGAVILSGLLLASLFAWHLTTGSIDVGSIDSRKSECFYWATIVFSQTLGTALGDWTADTAGLGYAGGMLVFGALLLVIVFAWFLTRLPRTALFWAAFVLTRPLGAVVGDFLDKPALQGGLELSRYSISAIILGLIVLTVLAHPQSAAKRAH
jgi:uncharacterized membrane-anchored protein